MQSLNPFLAAFFRSAFPAQCTPVHNHILLVPTTEALLTSRDRESGALYADLASSEEFLGSHVLRIPNNTAVTAGGKDAANMRETRGKAKQFTTINGRTVVIKDQNVFSNKGFKTHNQAQLLHDAVYYPDALEPRQWLIYYIAKPLIGVFEEITIIPAIVPMGNGKATNHSPQLEANDNTVMLPRKKDIKGFNDLLNHFPMIARQMMPGLERLFKEFASVFEKPLPPRPSEAEIPDPAPHGPIATAVRRARSNSGGSALLVQLNAPAESSTAEVYFGEDEEDVMRGALETAVTTAIDLFQMVDKQQLSLLGATTELTGPVVERLIERYITEQVHEQILWPRICSLKREEDLELESRIRHMQFVDISQVGIPIQDGHRGKHEISLRLGKAVMEFRKLNVAGCPQQMMDIILFTLKTVTQLEESATDPGTPSSEKPSAVLTINADTLVSLLLMVVIRAQIRYLQARLTYMRHFIFIDDVESGEMGYALSTFEAVLSYLARDSGGLRKASRRNKKLWVATTTGNLDEMQKILEPDKATSSESESDEQNSPSSESDAEARWNHVDSTARPSSSDRLSQASTLNHVFPFQIEQHIRDFPQPRSRSCLQNHVASSDLPRPRKRVTMDTRSMSSNSEASFHSKATTIDSTGSGIEGDTSVERLSHTEDVHGESVPMMAVQHKRPGSLRYLLSLEAYYPLSVILEDYNNEGTTLLSAAVQLGHTEIIEIILDFISQEKDQKVIGEYLQRQDVRGRSVAHYLFNAPEHLIDRIEHALPWRQKDRNGQTPLFALCRSYDHPNYRTMVEHGILAATKTQGDGMPLHLDDHIDAKGNTLLHIINDPQIALRFLYHCDADANATNDKRFTALMVASKYGRLEMVRALFSHPNVDLHTRDLRGLTAVELAKDDDTRNRIDDLMLFANKNPPPEGRITGVVRSFFVEDATIRLVVKSGQISPDKNITVTTCRRSLADFEHLANLLALENPASWLPSISGMRSPFQIPSKPSRAVLRDTQVRLDGFLSILLQHPTFATHEMLWEFFLVPDIQAEQMEIRSKLKAQARAETVQEEYEPIEDVRDVERFVEHAREMVRSVNHSTKSAVRRANALQCSAVDLHDAYILLDRAVASLKFLPESHFLALNSYVEILNPPPTSPYTTIHATLSSIHSTIVSILLSLSRPSSLITSINASRKAIDRSNNSLSRSTRWPLGLLDDARQRFNEEKEDKVKKAQEEKEILGRELRYTQQVVASELAGWQDLHERMGRQAIKEFVQGMVVKERAALDGMTRILRRLKRPVEISPGGRFFVG